MVIPTNQIKIALSTVIIECHYGTCPGLSWHGPAINQEAIPRYTISVHAFVSVLTISPVVEQDEGGYYCTCNGGRSGGPSNLLVNRKLLIARLCSVCISGRQ